MPFATELKALHGVNHPATASPEQWIILCNLYGSEADTSALRCIVEILGNNMRTAAHKMMRIASALAGVRPQPQWKLLELALRQLWEVNRQIEHGSKYHEAVHAVLKLLSIVRPLFGPHTAMVGLVAHLLLFHVNSQSTFPATVAVVGVARSLIATLALELRLATKRKQGAERFRGGEAIDGGSPRSDMGAEAIASAGADAVTFTSDVAVAGGGGGGSGDGGLRGPGGAGADTSASALLPVRVGSTATTEGGVLLQPPPAGQVWHTFGSAIPSLEDPVALGSISISTVDPATQARLLNVVHTNTEACEGMLRQMSKTLAAKAAIGELDLREQWPTAIGAVKVRLLLADSCCNLLPLTLGTTCLRRHYHISNSLCHCGRLLQSPPSPSCSGEADLGDSSLLH